MQLWTAIALALGVVLVGAAGFLLTRPKTLPSGSKGEGKGEGDKPGDAPEATAVARTSKPAPERTSKPAPERLSKPTPERTSKPAPERSSKPAPERTSSDKLLPKIAEPNEDEDDSELTVITLSPKMPRLSDLSNDDEREEEEHPDAPAKPIVVDDDAAADEPTRASPFILVSAAGQTDKGQKRKNNEDSYVVVDEHGLFVVADGMGGYAGGEIASALTVEVIEKAFKAQTFEGPAYENVPRRGRELARTIQMANKAVFEKAAGDPMLKGMGTTVVAARFSLNKQRLYLGHVGDSRCYRLREGKLEQITTDHTMAALGFTGPAFAHRLNRAVGTQPSVEIDLIIGRPRPDDAYLLCSDGLSKMVPDEELRQILVETKHPQQAIDQLIARANEKGGHDNITAILVCVKKPAEYIRSLREAPPAEQAN
ncbi:protein phosphatase 2C domain-containing protein [Polyangium mundeleinium]|uniref:Protein phosphatase 2C domain-containing protein n=1 Tax=Polyangium mundeleinium TaxID=2995306 RepID=A0ABT5EUS0_9BACT|nr:protein phosphatase 2C domain-containing protein [Polyangium mundeleinium]MDC0745564.1 protein phosphatase 2C domain-containing protein [Polyangium mundeleinium]